MTERLTNERLNELQRLGGYRAAPDPAVLALLADVVIRYPRAKIHWLTDTPEAICNDWYAHRLSGGRLAGMIDKAGSVTSLRSLAGNDLYQFAVDQRRTELPARLFKRIDHLLRSDPDRFLVMLPASDPGPTCWTLIARPATAMFSDRDHALRSLVLAVGLKTLDEEPDAKKQTQFIHVDELDRYVHQMLDRSGRGLTLDQLVRGLVVTYGLDPSIEELPDESTLADRHYAAEAAGVPMGDPPALPTDEYIPLGQKLIDGLTSRQLEIFKRQAEGYSNQREIADLLGCSPATVSAEMGTIRSVLSGLGTREEMPEILAATFTLLYGDEHEL
jgi:DNA-binding CsgD family transcriptional regulator